jgi:ankyrin repeat protein
MADGSVHSGEEEAEPEVDPVELALQLAPSLFLANKNNDTNRVLDLFEQKADPLAEDSKAWTPLIWASCHGNLTLTRKLIEMSASAAYRHDDGEERIVRKHSPLHWAAFKGHLPVLWLLLGEKLSPHEPDQIGNSVLHQAAAGGHLEVVECLLAQGVDVHGKNDRGHTPFVLCTEQSVRAVLQRAMDAKACKETGKQFSSTVMRYMCSLSKDFYSESAVTLQFVYDLPTSEAKEKPVTWCNEVKQTINEIEHMLNHAMLLNDLTVITEKLALAADQPVDVKLRAKCQQVQQKLESEIALRNAMDVPELEGLDDFSLRIDELSKAVDEATVCGADQPLVAKAKMLRRRLAAEYALTKVMDTQAATTSDAHLRMLEELAEGARVKSARPELLGRAEKVINRLHSEKEVMKLVEEAAPVAAKENAKALADMVSPEWVVDTDKFAEFHLQYKEAVIKAEQNAISAPLLEQTMGQLEKIETLLVQRKQLEAEESLKAAKKKGKKK